MAWIRSLSRFLRVPSCPLWLKAFSPALLDPVATIPKPPGIAFPLTSEYHEWFYVPGRLCKPVSHCKQSGETMRNYCFGAVLLLCASLAAAQKTTTERLRVDATD